MFSEKIKKYRKELKLTQKDFSKKIGISRATLGHLESGLRTPSKQVLEKLSLFSNKNINWWIDIKEFSKLSLLLKYTFKVGLIEEDCVVNNEEKQYIWDMFNKEIERGKNGEIGNLTIGEMDKLAKILCIDVLELFKTIMQQINSWED